MSDRFLMQAKDDDLSDEQLTVFAEKSIDAYLLILETSSALQRMGVTILQASLSVNIPGVDRNGISIVASPSLNEGEISELLHGMSDNAEASAHQAKAIQFMSESFIDSYRLKGCSDCQDSEGCDGKVKNETIN